MHVQLVEAHKAYKEIVVVLENGQIRCMVQERISFVSKCIARITMFVCSQMLLMQYDTKKLTQTTPEGFAGQAAVCIFAVLYAATSV
jgi:hypothetical protein